MSNTDKFPIDVSLVRKLIGTQFPQWAELPIKPVELSGWDNKTFHLGEHMSVRLPSNADYSSQVKKEHNWLPKLAPQLPLPIPTPLAMGKPSEEYPWHWSIYSWLDGNTASLDRIVDLRQFAIRLAEFLAALQQADATGGPMGGPHNFYRGGPLATYDDETRQAIATIDDKNHRAALTAVWEKALASTWQGHPVWVHGDIAIGNLLVEQGKLSAIIDFGCLGVGDPACDLAIAWTLFKGESRAAFRTILSLDNATWARGRGWTLWKALCWAFPDNNCIDTRVVDEVLADHQRED